MHTGAARTISGPNMLRERRPMPKLSALNAVALEALIPIVALVLAPLIAGFVSTAAYDFFWWLVPLSTIGAAVYIIRRYSCYRRYVAIALTAAAVLYTGFVYEYYRYSIDSVEVVGTEVKRFDNGGGDGARSSRDVFLLLTREEKQYRNEDAEFPSLKFDTANVTNRAEIQAQENQAARDRGGVPESEWIVFNGVRFQPMSVFPNAIMLTEGFPWFWLYYFSAINTIIALPLYGIQWLTWRVVMRSRTDEDEDAGADARADAGA
jgi:hypothetical protein